MERNEVIERRVVDDMGRIYRETTNISRVELYNPQSAIEAKFRKVTVVKTAVNSLMVFDVRGGSVARHDLFFPDYIPFKSHFKLSEDGLYLIPCYEKDSEFAREMPFGLTNFLGYQPVYISLNTENCTLYDLADSNCFSYFLDMKGGGITFYQSPLSNIYGGGKVCMGSSITAGEDIWSHKGEALFKHCTESWSNNDLDEGNYTKYARFRISDSSHTPSDSIMLPKTSAPRCFDKEVLDAIGRVLC